MVSISINIPKEMLDEIEAEVEESLVYENRSQYIRTAVRKLQESDEEFGQSS